MSTKLSVEQMNSVILQAATEMVERRKEEIIKEAVARFEKEVRRTVGLVVLQIDQLFSVERLGPELLIRVRIDTPK